jgi:6-phosphogluconate dehydrogenase
MVPAGKPVDAVLENITPLLNKGDIVVDAGNSYFKDTERRIADLASKGLHFMGMGVSGGEKGARTGPSIMPGGDLEAFNLLKPMLESIAAKVDGEACTAYMGKAQPETM